MVFQAGNRDEVAALKGVTGLVPLDRFIQSAMQNDVAQSGEFRLPSL